MINLTEKEKARYEDLKARMDSLSKEEWALLSALNKKSVSHLNYKKGV